MFYITSEEKRSLTCDKSLKIPKGQSEYVYRRRTDNKKDKQRSTKHTHKTKDRETQTPLIPGGELRENGGM